jgi:hypothetical protein
MKISAAITIMGALLIYQQLPNLYQGGMWAMLVIELIRQENTSSSFLTAYQRLEGTVIGAIYAVLIYQIFQCDKYVCGIEVQVPTLMIWLFVCAYFREGPQHGYSATVAGFTPIILLVGTTNTMASAWGRIEETFFGIVLYLIIDNVIMPRRVYPSITASVLSCISETKTMIRESMATVEVLIELEITDNPKQDDTQKTQASHVLKPLHCSLSSPIMGSGLYGSVTDVRQRTGSMSIAPSHEEIASVRDPESLLIEDSPTSQTPQVSSYSEKSHREFLELFHACKIHLDKSDLQLKQMKAQLALQSSLLSMVVHEPELWHRSFPLVAYSKLHHAFNKVYRSGLALTSGSRAFSVVLCQMLKREEEHVNMHLSHFRYMTRHLFHISAQADKALTSTLEAFKK